MNTPKSPRTKPKKWSEMHETERNQVLKELQEGGFGAELRARKLFSDEGFECYAYYFHDKDGSEGGKTREIDLFGFRKGAFRSTLEFYHTIIGEVKSGYTWILGDIWEPDTFDTRGVIEGPSPKWFDKESDKYPQIGTDPRDTHGDVSAINEACIGTSLLAKHLTTSIHQHRGDGPGADAWFDSATKIAKASGETANTSDIFIFTVPLLVLDGNLLAAVNGPQGLQLEPRDHVQVRFTYGSSNYPKRDIFIHIVTMDGLAPFLRKILATELAISSRISRFAKLCTE